MKKLLLSLFLALLAYQPALAADTKVADLTATTTPAVGDILYIVVDPTGTPLDRKVTVGNLLAVGNLTGLGTGVGTFLATPSGANLLAALTTKTGTGLPVFDTSPTISGATLTGATSFSNGQLAITGGTVTANAPVLALTQTWNNAGVTFYGLDLAITNTASAGASRAIRLSVGGTDQFLVSRNGEVSANNYVVTAAAGAIYLNGGITTAIQGTTAGLVQITDGSTSCSTAANCRDLKLRHTIASGAAPAVSNTSANSCGTTAATIAGGDESGKVTVGATSGTSCTVTFGAAYANAPACIVTNETTANLARATSTTTTAVLAGVFVAGDVLAYQCRGY